MIEFFFTKVLATLLLPPASPLLLILIGLVSIFLGRWRLVSSLAVMIGALSLWIFSTPVVASYLSSSLETIGPLGGALFDEVFAEGNPDRPQAIVVLGGGQATAPEYGGYSLTGTALQRVRYGAKLARRTRLPLLVTGGAVYGEPQAEATLMAKVLKEEFYVVPTWVESVSRNTAENAKNSAPILLNAGIKRILLVTHASHMPRSMAVFEAQGLKVSAAPTAFRNRTSRGLLDWLPRADALSLSSAVLYEQLGRLWYSMRY